MSKETTEVAENEDGKKDFVPMNTFIECWEASSSAQDCAKRTGLGINSVTTRASNYRSHGIPLKVMPRGTGKHGLDLHKALEQIASLRHVSIEQVQQAAETLKQQQVDKAAAKTANAKQSQSEPEKVSV